VSCVAGQYELLEPAAGCWWAEHGLSISGSSLATLGSPEPGLGLALRDSKLIVVSLFFDEINRVYKHLVKLRKKEKKLKIVKMRNEDTTGLVDKNINRITWAHSF
jgi:hypothetical protein